MRTRVVLHFDKDQVGHWVYPQPRAPEVWLTSWIWTVGCAPSSGQSCFLLCDPLIRETFLTAIGQIEPNRVI